MLRTITLGSLKSCLKLILLRKRMAYIIRDKYAKKVFF